MSRVDEIMTQIQELSGVEYDDIRSRMQALGDLDYDGLPAGAVILLGRDGRYSSSINGSPADQAGFDEYSDALDRLRVVMTDVLAPSDEPVSFVSLKTGLVLGLPPIGDIRPDFERAPDLDAHSEFFRLSHGAVGREAFCALCGEMFNPAGIDDMTHGQRASDEQPCGGPGVPVGWWF